MTLEEMFDAAEKEFLYFERIPESERRHPRKDICAFIYLHEKLGGKNDIICHASHDEICLDYSTDDCERLTLDDVVYIHRCGVRLDEDCLRMFV